MTRKLYSDINLINSILRGLTLVEKLDNGWTKKYFNTESGDEWLKYQTDSGYHGGGQTNLIKLPEPTTSELIQITVESDLEDEAIAAAARLRNNEITKNIEFRKELIDLLKKIRTENISVKEKERIKLVIIYTQLDCEINRRAIIGKNYLKIIEDAKFYQSVADEAK